MKCLHCSHENLPGSSFCQECGTMLSKLKKTGSHEGITLRNELEKIEDVIFKPKKKNSFLKNIFKLFLIVVSIGLVGMVGLMVIDANSNTTPDNTVVTDETDKTTFPIYYLEIKDLDSEWVGQILYIKGILRNKYSKHAKNVEIRIDFYKDENQQELFDTRYVTISGVAASGAYTFNEPVYITIDSRFWYTAKIESSDYL